MKPTSSAQLVQKTDFSIQDGTFSHCEVPKLEGFCRSCRCGVRPQNPSPKAAAGASDFPLPP